ncbi:hypothetical protein [Streptomyces lavendulocolor]|uniref:hypothetical protein n=1 Tax=Streptomyces lavendulocolor TaxID=67316 RepID=UPI00340904F4
MSRGRDEHGTTRQTVVGWLKTWTDEGVAVRVGEGTRTRYVRHRHTFGSTTD